MSPVLVEIEPSMLRSVILISAVEDSMSTILVDPASGTVMVAYASSSLPKKPIFKNVKPVSFSRLTVNTPFLLLISGF